MRYRYRHRHCWKRHPVSRLIFADCMCSMEKRSYVSPVRVRFRVILILSPPSWSYDTELRGVEHDASAVFRCCLYGLPLHRVSFKVFKKKYKTKREIEKKKV
jgi:hypothetical protein